MPPPYNTESESNQMAVESTEGSLSLKEGDKIGQSNTTAITNGDSSLSGDKMIMTGSTTDCLPTEPPKTETAAEMPMDM